MQLALALRTARPGGTPLVPDGIRGGLVRVAAALIERFTPDLYDRDTVSPPRYPDTDLSSPSRDVCRELIGVAEVEERVGLLVNHAERDPGPYGTDCQFFVDEPATTFPGTPTSHALEVRAESTRLEVSYTSVEPELTAAATETMRPALIAVADLVLARL
jgi:hypothetical protein